MSKQIALVTGGTRGIGFGIARALAEANYKLVVCGTREENSVEQALSELRQLTNDVLYCQCDVGNGDARKAMIDKIKKHFGGLNVLVNNAGIAPKVRADILEATEESYDQVMGINLKGPYFLTQAIANWMIEQKQANDNYQGTIINVSSISSTVASPSRGEYCLSKAGVSMATKLFAVRLGDFGIPVYEIRPGVIETDMTSVVKEKYDKLISEGLCVQKRWGQPEDIGKAAVMLANGSLPYSTGQVLLVDGGLTLERL